MSDAICDEAEAADRRDHVILSEKRGQQLVAMNEVEESMLLFAEHLKYPQARPDRQGRHAVVLMNGLPDMSDMLAYHFARLGWRHHPEKALVKQVRVNNGVFDDLVTYVGVDQPDDPITIRHDDVQEMATPTLDRLPWKVTPKVNEVYEKRPDD